MLHWTSVYSKNAVLDCCKVVQCCLQYSNKCLFLSSSLPQLIPLLQSASIDSFILVCLNWLFTLLPEGSFWMDLFKIFKKLNPVYFLLKKKNPQWLPFAFRIKSQIKIPGFQAKDLDYAYLLSFTCYNSSYQTLDLNLYVSWKLSALFFNPYIFVLRLAHSFIFKLKTFHWKIIALQCCVGFCRLTLMSHKYMFAPLLQSLPASLYLFLCSSLNLKHPFLPFPCLCTWSWLVRSW